MEYSEENMLADLGALRVMRASCLAL